MEKSLSAALTNKKEYREREKKLSPVRAFAPSFRENDFAVFLLFSLLCTENDNLFL